MMRRDYAPDYLTCTRCGGQIDRGDDCWVIDDENGRHIECEAQEDT